MSCNYVFLINISSLRQERHWGDPIFRVRFVIDLFVVLMLIIFCLKD